jgi:hypothetical protein
MLFAVNLDYPVLHRLLTVLDLEEDRALFGWTMWRVVVQNDIYLNVVLMDGEGTTVVMVKMLALYVVVVS